jgi:tetratricopeptide (TPR) repeat protein
MAARPSRSLAALALGALSLASFPPAALAQTSQFYSPPKILKQGRATSPVVGKGSVTLKVFVKKNGSVGAVTVVKSTNHGDDAAATEIAKSSTYKPGARDAKPEDAYYTLSLKFNGSAVTTDTGSSAGEVNQANALIRAGKYADAKTQLQSYLTGHPGDRDAEALLGVSDAYLNDSAGAAAAFDATGGTIPAQFKVVAGKAYSDAAVEALKAKNNDQAVAYADKALAIQPNVNGYYLRGTAYANAQKYPQAIADLEKAKSQAAAGKADAGTLNAIDSSLATSYLFGGQPDKGTALAAEVKRRDPSNTRVDDAIAGYYNQQASAAVQGGKRDQAVASLEAGAKAVPSRAVVLYTAAANVMGGSAKSADDWKRVKAEADKALAVNPNDAGALFIDGIASANAGDSAGARTALTKAKANVGSDADLSAKIDTALAQLSKTAPK